VRNVPAIPAAKSTSPYQPRSSAPARIESFEKKPENGISPTSASEPIRNIQRVKGISFPSPPIRRMSCSSWTAWMTEPEPRNSRPLKKPWVIRWKIAAANAPTPSDANM
jgi:hypothetical protein